MQDIQSHCEVALPASAILHLQAMEEKLEPSSGRFKRPEQELRYRQWSCCCVPQLVPSPFYLGRHSLSLNKVRAFHRNHLEVLTCVSGSSRDRDWWPTFTSSLKVRKAGCRRLPSRRLKREDSLAGSCPFEWVGHWNKGDSFIGHPWLAWGIPDS